MSPSLHAVGRWPVVAVITVVLLVAGGGIWAMTRSSGSSASTQVVAAKLATINQTVSASGTIAASKEADLDFGASGRVTSVKVAVGDKVHKGETLATLSTAALQASYDAANASVTSAQAAVTEAASGSSTQLTAAESALVAAKSERTTAKTALDDARLKATIRGTITAVNLTVGQSVSGSTSSGSGAANSGTTQDGLTSTGSTSSSSQISIQSTKTFIVNATVDDTEITSVKTGQAVAITPDGATSSISGTVSSVSSTPSTSSDVVSFPIVITVTGHPSGVYAGASATLVITTKHKANVLEIPTLAITYSGSTATVKVKSGGSTDTRTIAVGTTYGLETQVVSGLKSGERVVVAIPTFGNRPGGSRTGGTGGEGGFGGTGTTGGFGGGEGGFGGGAPGTFGSGSTSTGTTP